MNTKTVVLHYKKVKERKQNMIDQLTKFGFTDYSFYEQYDGNELTEHDINTMYQPKVKNPLLWMHKVSLWGPAALHYHAPQLNLAEISLTIKFGKVFELLSKEDFDYCIVFEDDVILCDDFDKKFKEYMEKTPKDWDVIYFGSGANLHPKNPTTDVVAYTKDHPASRCGDSTIFTKKAIQDLVSTWFPFNLISDWELGYQHYLHKHKVYWWEPSLSRQGSETGTFKSELR
jgi:GR25 family glycosyltransferase involved in LPS biosynthesis